MVALMQCFALIWVLAMVTGSTVSGDNGDNRQGTTELIKKKRRSPPAGRKVAEDKDYLAVANLQPMKDGENVMFWRPQKVGSSSVLSLLMSYGYRYNFLPRRKTGNNAVCRKLGQCTRAYNVSIYGETERQKRRNRIRPSRSMKAEYLTEKLPQKISLQHEICFGKPDLIHGSLPCSFSTNGTLLDRTPTDINNQVKEIFMVREPVSRAISSYYFWGELYRMSRLKKRNATSEGVDFSKVPARKSGKKSERAALNREAAAALNGQRRLAATAGFQGFTGASNGATTQISAPSASAASGIVHNGGGDSKTHKPGATIHSPRPFVRMGSDQLEVKPVQGRFKYHGNENTVPPLEYAMAYSSKPPFKPGMPGPSLVWSLFTNTAESALEIVRSDRMMTIVLERLDESLVVARHYLKWSLADMVVTKMRKALSHHPKKDKWPAAAVSAMHSFFESHGDMELYNASCAKLDSRIAQLKQEGVDVDKEVADLKAIRKHVTKACLDLTYLESYRLDLNAAGLPQHSSRNKLRDVENLYADAGHTFSFNREILGSFDVCGSCEAHGTLLSMRAGVAIKDAPRLQFFDRKLITPADQINFAKCPRFFVSQTTDEGNQPNVRI